jgi:hypothetical protein
VRRVARHAPEAGGPARLFRRAGVPCRARQPAGISFRIFSGSFGRNFGASAAFV